MEITKEQVEQLKACTTVEELKAYVESMGGKITDEQAVEALKIMDEHRNPKEEGKISDDALADVDGGWDWTHFFGGFMLTACTIGIGCVIMAIDAVDEAISKMKK